MNNLILTIYTHSDMKDVWPMFFGQLKNYMSDYKVHIFIDKKSEEIPKEYNQVIYDDSKKYTDRVLECLDKINDEIILFFHEDMILYSNPLHEYLAKYYGHISNNNAETIKLLFAGNEAIKSSFDETLFQNDFSKFSVQPTILKVNTFKSLLKQHPSLGIYEFEDAVKLSDKDFSASNEKEKKRGIFHYDSFVFPYIATAINKGKWNLTEYQNELNPLFEKYNINPFDRGIW